MHHSLAGQTLVYLTANIQLIANTGRPHLRSASKRMCHSMHTHTTASVTEVSLLLVLVFEMPCGHIYNRT